MEEVVVAESKYANAALIYLRHLNFGRGFDWNSLDEIYVKACCETNLFQIKVF